MKLTTHINYRPDIDGLRAVAVLSVLFYHAGVPGFTGGYVGVDVFFVISGFLITRLLRSEIQKNGKVDFSSFYLRRVRRLLPAYTFIVIGTTLVAVWLFSPTELRNYGATLLHASLSVSNIYFYTQSGYFNAESALAPLLHTWSLGVEEQFYVIWPFLLLLLSRKKWLSPFFIILIGFVSLYFAQYLVESHNAAVFFLTPFRIFEFSIGAILAWLENEKFKPSVDKEFLLWLGIALIAISVLGYSEKTLFPGLSALLPCIGAALCIYSGSAKFSGIILRNKIFVGIGLISYSLYLAHWPLIVFYKHYTHNIEISNFASVKLVAISFAVAIFMYFLIERPFRKNSGKNGQFLFSCLVLTLLTSYLGASMWATGGWEWRKWASTGSISQEEVKAGMELRFQTRQRICQIKGWDVCDQLAVGKINALVIGDSHAVDALNAFEKIYPSHNYSMSTLGGCPPHHDIREITSANHPDRIDCLKLNNSRFDADYLKKFDYIVINVLFGWYTSEHLYEYLRFLKDNGIQKVIVLGDYLTLRKEMHELLSQYGYNQLRITQSVAEPLVDELEFKSRVNSLGYFFLSKRSEFCKNGSCDIFDSNRVPFTYDKHHLSYEFSVRIALNKRDDLNRYLEFDERLVNYPGSNNGPIGSDFSKMKVNNWGPRLAEEGVIPNIQPGGAMGVWIEVSETQGVGELEVYFNGQRALKTSVQEKLITAAISPEMLTKPGKYSVVVKQLSTNKLLIVGDFELNLSK